MLMSQVGKLRPDWPMSHSKVLMNLLTSTASILLGDEDWYQTLALLFANGEVLDKFSKLSEAWFSHL